MDLNDALKNVLGASAPPEEKAVVEIIEGHLQRIKQNLRDGRMNLGLLQGLIAGLRGQVIKIYGKNSEIITYFQPIREKLSPDDVIKRATVLTAQAETFIEYLKKAGSLSFAPRKEGKIFIGHGRSLLWRELKDFLSDRLGLSWDEFNREAVAGFTTSQRLSQMLSESSFAFLIMTAEDEYIDQSFHARENVVHEVGLFQGRLGTKRAIILLEEGCEEFSNIVGLSQIRFPKGHVNSTFEEIRKVLEREGIIKDQNQKKNNL